MCSTTTVLQNPKLLRLKEEAQQLSKRSKALEKDLDAKRRKYDNQQETIAKLEADIDKIVAGKPPGYIAPCSMVSMNLSAKHVLVCGACSPG